MTRITLIAAVITIPFIGYGIMHMLAYIMPISEQSDGYNLFFTLILIALGLTIPYLMLKMGAHAAHLRDPREKDISLADLPKDKDQLARDL